MGFAVFSNNFVFETALGIYLYSQKFTVFKSAPYKKLKNIQYALFENGQFLQIRKKISRCGPKNQNDAKNSKNHLITIYSVTFLHKNLIFFYIKFFSLVFSWNHSAFRCILDIKVY